MTLASSTRAMPSAACPKSRANARKGGRRGCLFAARRWSRPPSSIALVAHSSPVSSSDAALLSAPPATERTEMRRRGGDGGSWRTTSTFGSPAPLATSTRPCIAESILGSPSSSRDASIHSRDLDPLGTSTRSPPSSVTRPISVGGPRPWYRRAFSHRPAPTTSGSRSSGRWMTPATTASTEPPARSDSRHHPTRRPGSCAPPSPRWRGPGVGQKSRSAGAIAERLNKIVDNVL